MLRNDRTRYGAVAQALHWLVAALVIGMIGLGFYMEGLPRGLAKLELYNLHKSLGVTIFVLVLARLLWRLANPAPPLPAVVAGWERSAAFASHTTLYALLLIQPTIGFLQSNAANFPVTVFGVLPLPVLLAPNEALADILVQAHAIVGIALAVLIAVHSAAALRHHFVLKDDVLRRMLPGATGRH